MDASWNALVDAMLRPERPLLARCRARAEAHATAERRTAEHRAQALADCRARIEIARTSVFEAGDGVVDGRMTALEREWLALARGERSYEERMLVLWNEIAPRRWAGRLRWSSTGDKTADLDGAVALASDPEGVERAESCALRFASALSAWGFESGSTVTWRIAGEPTIDTPAHTLLDGPLRALADAIAPTYGAEALAARAQRVERDVLDAAMDSPLLSTREDLAADVALVARIDFSWRACALEARCVPAGHPNAGRRFDELELPAAALLDLWRTGYVLCAIDGGGVTLGAPTLRRHRCTYAR
jgi:hypothetical protein